MLVFVWRPQIPRSGRNSLSSQASLNEVLQQGFWMAAILAATVATVCCFVALSNAEVPTDTKFRALLVNLSSWAVLTVCTQILVRL
jgi:hypothetical protein